MAKFARLADGTEARTLIRRLNGLYDAGGTAFRVETVAGGYQLLTRPRFGRWIRRWHRLVSDSRLSGPALETIAIVAYRQPVLRADIEAIRGVQCGEMLRQLMERDLVRIAGRANELGRPFLYGTTKHFLEVFGLGSLADLPRAELLKASGTPSANLPKNLPDHRRAGDPARETGTSITGREESVVRTAISGDPVRSQWLDELLVDPQFALRGGPVASDEELDDEEFDDEEDDEEEEEEGDDEEEEDEWEEVDDEEFDEEADDEEDWDEEEDEDWEEEEDEEEDEEDWEEDEEGDDDEEEWEEGDEE